MQKEINTQYLESELKQTENLEEFLGENAQNLRAKTVPEYLNDMLIKYNIEKNEVVRLSGLSGTYAYQIFDGKRSAGREKLIQLAFGFPLTLEETQKLLRFGGHSELYVKKKREAFIMYALGKGYTINQINDLLYQNGEETFE
ncbi:MAG: XRE family transcriptional regulator [Lachnospiraceae bacterium]|nr:XRE family transcriptional regulator [Lachnospiraceae bacterium]